MDSHSDAVQHSQDPATSVRLLRGENAQSENLKTKVLSKGPLGFDGSLSPTETAGAEVSSSSSSAHGSLIYDTKDNDSRVAEISDQILEIIFEYALNKFSDTKQRLELGRHKFLLVIERFVITGSRVEMCLPAFPFKSANKVYKVLGVLPDKAEEFALRRLNNMCIRIKDIYPPGASLMIISDGLVYNGMSVRH
jgi:hypothetical protein